MLKSILVLITLSLFLGTAAWLFFVWAVKKGFFDDMEGPKYRMLEEDDEAEFKDRNSSANNNNEKR